MAASIKRLMNRGTILVLALALLAALLVIQPVRAQDRPPVPDPIESKTIEVPENTVAVSRFTARDIDTGDRKIFWTLGGEDAASFKIENGVLEFKSAPNYENLASRSYSYDVTVRMSSGGEHGVDLGTNDRQSGNDVTEIEVTVNVINVNEDGSVVLYPRQPQIGSTLRAYLGDPDGSASGESWQWASSNSMSGPFTDIPALSTDSAYRPTTDDLGKYLRATVKYVDAAGGTPDDPNEAMVVSTLPVREDTVTSNDAPKFPDQSTLGIETPATGPRRTTTERFVVENSPAGTKVGAPVTAIDDAHRLDELSYSLSDGETDGVGAAANFRIDVETGQITVAPGASLNAETTPTYNVKVTAIDGDEDSASINVTIRVLDQNEGPTIRSTYPVGVPTGTGHSDGDRVATEMSHPEVDRRSSEHQAVRNTLRDADDTTTNIGERDALKIDTDLDNGIEDIDGTDTHDAAVYYASDQDGGTETAELAWSLEGDDGWLFYITDHAAADDSGTSITGFDAATLSFKTKEQLKKTHPKSPVLDDYPNFPDFENARDKNRDNVYEVTLVVTDQNSGLRAEFPVTVKVINSGEDNEPGKVRILNRQPEIGVELVAELTDADTPITRVNWQWYRAVAASTGQGVECTPRDPFNANATPYHGFRYFLDPQDPVANTVWKAISGAKGTGTTAKYTPDYKGAGATRTLDPNSTATSEIVDWTDGDIAVTETTDTSARPQTVTYSDWDAPKCLRVAFTYEDAVDRTFQKTDTDDDGVNQILEGAFVGSENSVKRHDLENNKPEFQGAAADGGGPDGTTVLTYTVTKDEEPEARTSPDIPALAFSTTIEVLPAVDTADPDTNVDTDDQEDDRASNDTGLGNDRLTYSLSGPDAKYFVIVGSVDHPTGYDSTTAGTNDITTPGQLSFKRGTKLNYDRPDGKRVYRVTITATDPSGDKGSSSVDVIVNITDVNEEPEWLNPKGNGIKVRHEENGTAPVFSFKAMNPETPNPGPGTSYSLVTAEVTGADAPTGTDAIGIADVADSGQFSINELTGALSFKSPPNYEKPADVEAGGAANDNEYQVAVMAVAADRGDPGVAITTVYRKITVIVTNVNEAPVFSDESFTLRIRENIDDLHKEPTQERGPLYLLNRGVGIPGTNLPAAPNLDVGTPVRAGDDDSTGEFAITTPADVRDRVDGLTYELMGSADALETFTIVPATGQILSQKKLDHEKTSSYKVTVKATDPWKAYDTIALTIDVTNEEEQPRPKRLIISGANSYSHEENSEDDLGEYTVSATGGASASPTWTLKGADAEYFDVAPKTGAKVMLKFETAPDYDAEADADGDNVYEVTLKVTDPSDSTVVDDLSVKVNVTDVDELGTLSGSTTASINEGSTDALSTYTLTGTAADTADWDLGGADKERFMLDGTGMSRMLKFKRPPDYERPMGGADDDSNTYMVTVMAEAGGEMEMVDVTVTVDNVDEVGMISGPARPGDYIENGTGAVATYTTTGPDTATWSVEGDDGEDFTIIGGMLEFSSPPNFEDPADANTDNVYMVTVKAVAGREEETKSVTVTVTGVNEAPMVSGDDRINYAENGTGPVATYTAIDPEGDVITWSRSGADVGDFTIEDGVLMFNSAPDYETPMGGADNDSNTYTVMVTATDPDEESDSITATVMVTNVNENMPTFSAETVTTLSVAEDTAAGMDIGTAIEATDADAADTLTYTLGGADMASFDIDSTTGQLRTKAALDYETKMTYMVTVNANDGNGGTDSIDVTINVTDVNDAPAFPSTELGARDIAENTAAGMDIGAPVAAADADAGDTLTYTLGGTDAASFDINARTGQLMTKAALDRETKASYTVTVTASDGTDSDAITVTITVTDVDETVVGDALLVEYDPNNDNRIEKVDMRRAVANYFGSSPTLTKAEMRRLVGIYFAQ